VGHVRPGRRLLPPQGRGGGRRPRSERQLALLYEIARPASFRTARISILGSFSDPQRAEPDDSFAGNTSETVYLGGSGYAVSAAYVVAYYDATGLLVFQDPVTGDLEVELAA